MGSFFSLATGTIFIFSVFVLHSCIAYIAPAPFNRLHAIFLSLLVLVVRDNKQKALWLGLIFGYLTELFSAEVFGVHLITLLVSISIANWLLRSVFTNHSWYIITVVGALSFLAYRVFFMFAVAVSSGFKNTMLLEPSMWLETVFSEVAINTVALVVLYSISVHFFKQRSNG